MMSDLIERIDQALALLSPTNRMVGIECECDITVGHICEECFLHSTLSEARRELLRPRGMLLQVKIREVLVEPRATADYQPFLEELVAFSLHYGCRVRSSWDGKPIVIDPEVTRDILKVCKESPANLDPNFYSFDAG